MKIYFLSMQSLMGVGYFSWDALLQVMIQGSKNPSILKFYPLKSLSLPAAKMGGGEGNRIVGGGHLPPTFPSEVSV